MLQESFGGQEKDVSKATLARMPAYLRYLKEAKAKGVKYLSSTSIAADMAVSAVLVRKDLAFVSSAAGKPRVGFAVERLIEDIEQFLGYNNVTDALVVGVGGLGKAFLSYEGFKNYGLNIIAGFDVNPTLVHTTIHQKPIFHLTELSKFVQHHNINIGIIAVPKKYAQDVCGIMVRAGLKAIWNFAPVKLTVPKGVIVRYEDLAASL
ncbi:MAG: redox-sensing transcriptional repressor Rex, partial [Clostridia bacterium]|nr:redox-sensing transcriptional repressor Rex [Clostridia bacterium]